MGDLTIEFSKLVHLLPGPLAERGYYLQQDCATLARRAIENALERRVPIEAILADADRGVSCAREAVSARLASRQDPRYKVTDLDVLEVTFYRHLATEARRKQGQRTVDAEQRNRRTSRHDGELRYLVERRAAATKRAFQAAKEKRARDAKAASEAAEEKQARDAKGASNAEAEAEANVDSDFVMVSEADTVINADGEIAEGGEVNHVSEAEEVTAEIKAETDEDWSVVSMVTTALSKLWS